MKESSSKPFGHQKITIVALGAAAIMMIIFAAGLPLYNHYDKHHSPEAIETSTEAQETIVAYDVISVNTYVKTTTNSFGGDVVTQIRYAFVYSDGIQLKFVDDFYHNTHGYTKIVIGDRNSYIVNSTDNTKILQLTKDTLESLGGHLE